MDHTRTVTASSLSRLGVRTVPVLLLVTALLLAPAHAAPSSSPIDKLSTSGGTVLLSSSTYAIFWLPAGTHFEPAGSDSTYQTLLQQFLRDVGGTSFYAIVTQYPDGSFSFPTTGSTLGGTTVDTTPYPHAGTATDPLQDSDVQAAVILAMAANGWAASPTSLFLVYTASGIQSCLDSPGGQCSSDTFCAYHSWFLPAASSQPIYYAALPDAGNGSGTCLTQGAGGTYPNHDALADSEISLTSKELFAIVTDPQGDGWTDSTGAEIGDKCDGLFGTQGADGSNVTLGNGHPYLVQEEWSNDAGGLHDRWKRPLPTQRSCHPYPDPRGHAHPGGGT